MLLTEIIAPKGIVWADCTAQKTHRLVCENTLCGQNVPRSKHTPARL
jgi:hypothetical protein